MRWCSDLITIRRGGERDRRKDAQRDRSSKIGGDHNNLDMIVPSVGLHKTSTCIEGLVQYTGFGYIRFELKILSVLVCDRTFFSLLIFQMNLKDDRHRSKPVLTALN